MTTYPLARRGVFRTIQGEGSLMGEPQVFVRLAGCSIGCPECDTDYRVHIRATVEEIIHRVVDTAGSIKWVWITGGEPTDHDLIPLVMELRKYGFRPALATSGVKNVIRGFADGTSGFEFVSVSPHRVDDESWVLRRGDQLNFVPGLNGLTLDAMNNVDVSGFNHKFITPLWDNETQRTSQIQKCVDWLDSHPDWKLGIQAHKFWGLE